MSERFFQIEPDQYRSVPDGADLVEFGIPVDELGAPLVTETDRLPRRHEHWDEVAGAWVLDADKLDAELHAKIDHDAGAFRLLFITDVPGQMAAYQDKEKAARAFLAGSLDPNEYELITLEAAVRGITETEMAEMVVSIADQWRALGNAIEAKRQEAKLAVTAAVTWEAKVAAAEVDWMALLPPPGGE